MGPLVACVYVADKALPLHDTYIHTYHENLSAHSTFYFFFLIWLKVANFILINSPNVTAHSYLDKLTHLL